MNALRSGGGGSWAIRVMPSRNARNPKTGEMLVVGERKTVHFKMGKELAERVTASMLKGQ